MGKYEIEIPDRLLIDAGGLLRQLARENAPQEQNVKEAKD